MTGTQTITQANGHIVGDELTEIGFAKEFIEAVYQSSVLDFADESLRQKILTAPGDQLLIIKSTINSPKLVRAVEYYNKSLISDTL